MAHLKARGIGSLIHYPIPIPRQPAMESSRPDALSRWPTESVPKCVHCRSIRICRMRTRTA